MESPPKGMKPRMPKTVAGATRAANTPKVKMTTMPMSSSMPKAMPKSKMPKKPRRKMSV